jgi:beta-glucosidase
MSRMTLDDKLGQMTLVERGALARPADIVTYRLGSLASAPGSAPAANTPKAWADLIEEADRQASSTPLHIPLLYGVDAVHGNGALHGATIFPHNIGLGATRDPGLAQRIGRATAEEVAATGVNWTFAPCLCVARDDRWGGTYRSFGEDPTIGTALSSVITGLQGRTLGGPASVLATATHFLGDGGTDGGTDGGDTELSEHELRRIHLPPFKAAIDRGVGSVMVSYSSWNDVRMPSNRFLLTDVLKRELGFAGFVVSDWSGIDQLDGQPGFSQTEVVAAVNAGVDMVALSDDYPTFLAYLRSAVQFGQVPVSRIDDANRRILTRKFQLGLFEHPYPDRALQHTVGSPAHRALAREAVRESQVLLKNTDGILPLNRNGGRYLVAGKSADDIGNATGGWTIGWQGRSGAVTRGTTILEGIRNAVGPDTDVFYSQDGTGVDSSFRAAIAVVGETPYAGAQGDRHDAMRLDATDQRTLDRLRAAGIPVVVVLISGRPLDITAEIDGWAALIEAWLPGTEGDGVADVLFGAYNPTGRLPVTWMRSADQEPINEGDGQQPLFPLGYGLSYPRSGGDGDDTPSTVPSVEPSVAVALPTPVVPPPPTGGSDAIPGTGRTAGPRTSKPKPAPPAARPDPRRCIVSYHLLSIWPDGFVAEIEVSVQGFSVDGWQLSFGFPMPTSVSSTWNATTTQNGSRFTAVGQSGSSRIQPGSPVTFGFNASYGDTYSDPSGYSLDGLPCSTA